MQIIFVQPLAIRIAYAYIQIVPITARRNLHGANMRKSSKTATPAPFASLGKALVAAAKADAKHKPITTPTTRDAKADAKADAAAIATAARAVAATTYNGPSLAVRHGNPKIAALIARVKSPVQIADNLTVRDLSGLAAIKSVADAATGEFNPLLIKLDAGVCSRLASRGLIAVNAAETGLRLTDTGRTTKA